MKLSGFLAGAALALSLAPAALTDQAGRDNPPGPAPAERDGRVVVAQQNPPGCPPGQARDDGGCLLPGQAAHGPLVGRVVDWNDVHVVRKPGLYGLADPPEGQHYAIIDGRLVRIEARSAKVLSVIRDVEAILD